MKRFLVVFLIDTLSHPLNAFGEFHNITHKEPV